MLTYLWKDEAGVLVSAELILIATILVLGLLAGLTTVRDQAVQELGDLAAAITQANQSMSFSGITGHHSSSAGSLFIDTPDDCQGGLDDPPGFAPLCIELGNVGASGEN